MLPGERLAGGLICSQVLEDLSAYLDDELEVSRRAQIEAHVADCQNCASFGAGFAKMLDEVRARLATPEPVPDDIAARLRTALLSEHLPG